MNTENTQRWGSVKELLHQALQLAPESRDAFLDEACSSYASLRAELASLLAAEEDVRSSFMQSPVLAKEWLGVEPYGVAPASVLEPGQTFSGRFQLVRKLGEGGMGQVWLVEQTSPVRRQVALKLIRAGMYDQSTVQRFRAEWQSLAIMDHPAIAKVFDAGTTDQGQPYFVMEYVAGLPIHEYCDQKKLTIKQRLDLFIQACDGVKHAHQKAIIHRDLKPANIIVAEVDGRPMPRIIDFGLARAAQLRLDGQSLFTQAGHFVGTPAYMSPEQATPDGQDIDTRTDVYSLGVVLYVLLTGGLPLEVNQQPLFEVLQRLREEEPARPSTKVSSDRHGSTRAAAARRTEAAQLAGLLRGDLDWITMKAIEKDRARRYATPTELAEDVRRYLNHEPVTARPASAIYRLQKYARRHRVRVGVAALLMLLFAGFAVLQAVQIRRITRERDRANRERDRATRITDFMTSMFKVSDPSQARGNSVTAREILDKASADMGKGLAQDPEVQAQMMDVMARTYMNLGLYPRAHELAKGALDSRVRLLGANDPKTLESMSQLGWVLIQEGHYRDGENLEREAIDSERRVLGAENPLTLETMGNLAATLGLEGHQDEQDRLIQQVVEIESRALGRENPQTLSAMHKLAVAQWSQGRYRESEQSYRQLVEVERRVLGPDHPQTLGSMANLASALEAQGQSAEAEKVYREALAGLQHVLGPEHKNTALVMTRLAEVLVDEGKDAEAEKLYRDALAIRLRNLGPEHADTLQSRINLAELLLKQGHVQEAEEMQKETMAISVRVLGAENPQALWVQSDLSETFTRERQYSKAERIAKEAFEIELRKLGPIHPETLYTLHRLGIAMAYNHRYAEASKLFHDAIQQEESSRGKGNLYSVWYSFACTAMAGNLPDDALKYLREAVNRGYKDVNGLLADDDLKDLRQNPDFRQLVAQLRQRSTISRQ